MTTSAFTKQLDELRKTTEAARRQRQLRWEAEPRARFAHAAAATKLDRKADRLSDALLDAGCPLSEVMEASGLSDYM